MKKAVSYTTLLYISFIVLLSVAGTVGGVIGAVIEPLAFAVPVFIGYYLSIGLRREREEVSGVAECGKTLFGLDRRGVGALLPLIAPTMAIVFLISWLTSLLLSIMNMTSPAVADEPLIVMLVVHALIPALLEEMLFRYLPMKLIAPYSRRWCVIISSLYFALVHLNAFQIPYAFFAGLVFIFIDIIAESVWPSVIIHLLNNTVSVLWIKYSANPDFALWYCILLAAFGALSLIPIYLRRKKYLAEIKSATSEGERLGDTYAPILFVAFTLIMTVINLFS